MRKTVQVVAALNALFQIGVGLCALAAPHVAAGLFKVQLVSSQMIALVRLFGAVFASLGVVSALLALDPDRDRTLARAFAGCLLLNLAGDAAAIAAHEMRFDQLAAGMVLELVFALLLIARRPASR